LLALNPVCYRSKSKGDAEGYIAELSR